MSFKLEILTPAKVFFDDDADGLMINSTNGPLTVLTGHAPMVAPLEIGDIKIKQNDAWRDAFCSEGFLEVTRDKVSVFAQAAEWAEDIDLVRADEARQRAVEKLLSKESAAEHKINEMALARAMARIRIAKKL